MAGGVAPEVRVGGGIGGTVVGGGGVVEEVGVVKTDMFSL